MEGRNKNNELPVSKGQISFTGTENGPKVEFKMNYPTGTDIEKIVEMGFERCFLMYVRSYQNFIKN